MTARPTILVVDDDSAVRTLVGAFLSAAGYAVVEAVDGQEALDIFHQHSTITLVISDVIMPGMSGPELCDRLLQIRPTLKVLFISGYVERSDLGGVELLPKPFAPAELLQRLQKMIGSRPRPARSQRRNE